MATIVDFVGRRIERSPIADAMRDFVSGVRAEYGDDAAMQELRLIESFGDCFEVEYDDLA